MGKAETPTRRGLRDRISPEKGAGDSARLNFSDVQFDRPAATAPDAKIFIAEVIKPEVFDTDTARRFFLRAAANHPQIRLGVSLDEKVLGPLEIFARKLGILDASEGTWTATHFRALDPYYQERDRLIQRWADANNLDFEWVHRAAMSEITTWKAFPRRPKQAFGQFRRLYTPESQPEWPPCWKYWAGESERAYRVRALQHARRDVVAEIRAARKAQKGLTDSQQKNYQWAAERVCLEWTWAQIAASKYNQEGVTPQAVSKAVLPLLRKLSIPSSQPKSPKN